jgi:O-antigen ligase
MRDRALNLFYLISTLIALADPILLRYARASLIYCVLLGVAINVYEFFFPSTFSVVDGRSAGLYMNPNQCGAALVFGLILAMGAVPPRYRLLFVLAGGLGVVLTFSRAAFLGYMLCVVTALLNGTLRLRDSLSLRIAVPLVALAILAYTGVKLSSSSGDNATVRKGIYERIMDIGASTTNMDDSAQARVAAAERSLALFADRPLTGHGTGRAREYPLDYEGPHNMYLFYMVDHGVLGSLILPAFAICCALGARAEAGRIAGPFVVFLLFWGLFSHNVIEERYILLSMAMMASLADRDRIAQIRRGTQFS